MKRRLPPRSGNTMDRLASRMPFRVVTPQGRQLAGCNTAEGAARIAAVFNQGRTEPVSVVARGGVR